MDGAGSLTVWFEQIWSALRGWHSTTIAAYYGRRHMQVALIGIGTLSEMLAMFTSLPIDLETDRKGPWPACLETVAQKHECAHNGAASGDRRRDLYRSAICLTRTITLTRSYSRAARHLGRLGRPRKQSAPRCPSARKNRKEAITRLCGRSA